MKRESWERNWTVGGGRHEPCPITWLLAFQEGLYPSRTPRFSHPKSFLKKTHLMTYFVLWHLQSILLKRCGDLFSTAYEAFPFALTGSHLTYALPLTCHGLDDPSFNGTNGDRFGNMLVIIGPGWTLDDTQKFTWCTEKGPRHQPLCREQWGIPRLMMLYFTCTITGGYVHVRMLVIITIQP